MSINFPDTPTLNQVFTDMSSGRMWLWDGEKWVAQSSQLTTENIENNAITNIKLRDSDAYSVIGRAGSTSGDPADIVAGTAQHVLKRGTSGLEFGQITADGITNSTITAAKINVATAGTTGQVLTANTGVTSGLEWTTPVSVPTGTIVQYAGTTEPSGWFFCYGGTKNRADYQALFATFATTFTTATTNTNGTVSNLSGMATATHVGWGIAGTNIPSGATITGVTNATTVTIIPVPTGNVSLTANIAISPYGFTGANNTLTFNLPNLGGRVPTGIDSSDDFKILGKASGSKTSTATHTHDIAHPHGSSKTGSISVGVTGGAHEHRMSEGVAGTTGAGDYAAVATNVTNSGINTGSTGLPHTTHTHTVSVTDTIAWAVASAPTGTLSQNANVGIANGNLVPYIALNFIIKT